MGPYFLFVTRKTFLRVYHFRYRLNKNAKVTLYLRRDSILNFQKT